jgi:dTDP-4-dehydrorhamnose 3,5-epimerase
MSIIGSNANGEVSDLSMSGLKLIQLKIFSDERGYFVERYQKDRFKAYGLPENFYQDNHSLSKPGVIRGLHYQHSPNQGKLVGCIRGRIWDVVVDIRKNSPTFGKWEGIELSAKNGKLLWVPPGFAHGFCVLGDEEADVMYKVDQPYSPKTEGGIVYSDPTLAIEWPIKNALVSGKDKILPTFSAYTNSPVF